MGIWKKSAPGKGKNQHKGPEAELWLCVQKSRKEASVAVCSTVNQGKSCKGQMLKDLANYVRKLACTL